MPGQIVRRVIQLLIGLFCYGLGIAFLLSSTLGSASWDVLTQGISHHVSFSFGTITVIVSGIVLLLWIPLREKPGIGTVSNALLVGPSADVCLWLLPEPDELWLRVVFVALGILTIGFATGLYIGSRFGPGPRDGLMTALHRITRRPIWQVRLAIELTVVAIGWLLGGTVGLGTIAVTIFVGPACQLFMEPLRVRLSKDVEPNIVASLTAEGVQPMVEEPA